MKAIALNSVNRSNRLVLSFFRAILLVFCGGILQPVPEAIFPMPTASAQGTLSVPAAKERTERRKEIRQQFAVDEAETKAQKLALARELLGAAKTVPNDPVAKFVLLNLAREKGEESGDVSIAFQAIDALAAKFKFNDIFIRGVSIRRASAAQDLTSADRRVIGQAGAQIVDQLIRAERFNDALNHIELMEDVAASFRDEELQALMRARRAEVDRSMAIHDDYLVLTRRLENTPKDAGTLSQLGRLLLFEKQKWREGLAYLATSDDGDLALIARSELAIPESGDDRMRLAEQWYAFGLANESDSKIHHVSWGRAAALFRRAILDVSGSDRVKANLALGEIRDQGIQPIDIDLDRPTDSAEVPDRQNVPVRTDGVRDLRGGLHQDRATSDFDVLSWVRLPRDQLAGQWAIEQTGIVAAAAEQAMLRLPVVPPRQYDLIVDLEPLGDDRNVSLVMTAPKGQRFSVHFQAYSNRQWSGIDYIDGKNCMENETWFRGDALDAEQPNRIVVSVRNSGITVRVNDRSICRYRGRMERLSVDPSIEEPNRSAILIGANETAIRVNSVKLKVWGKAG